ncbi:MAG TPA: hypothetical protein VME40_00610 [Caulobacteraceae bacterium]|nr:hypothetical protein [Caulobacteraceae bacterium]
MRARPALIAWWLAATPALAMAQAATPAAQAAASNAVVAGETVTDNAIDDRIRDAAAAAEALQGPLDGSWTLVAASGKALYAFQFVDKPGGQDPPEGVWRDLRRPPGPGDIGLIGSMARGPGSLSLGFAAKPGARPVAIELKSGGSGGWSGQLHEDGVTINVMLRRN